MSTIKAIYCHASWIECPSCGYAMRNLVVREKFNKLVEMVCKTYGCEKRDKVFELDLPQIILREKENDH